LKAHWLLGLLLVQGVALPCCGITLRQFLSDQSIPAESFSKAELEAEIQGLATKHGEQTIAAIQHLSGELLIGPICAGVQCSTSILLTATPLSPLTLLHRLSVF
jgi:hypothetical protein